MKVDKVLSLLLLINLCLAFIFHWATWNKVLVVANGLALLLCVAAALIRGGRKNG